MLDELEKLAASYFRLYRLSGSRIWLKRQRETIQHIGRIVKTRTRARRMPQDRDE